jgi:hypothetical protein
MCIELREHLLEIERFESTERSKKNSPKILGTKEYR